MTPGDVIEALGRGMGRAHRQGGRAWRLSDRRASIAGELRRIGRLLGRRGIFVADDGNLSARCPDGTIWITARGVRKDALRPGDVVRVAMDGARLEGSSEPSSEIHLHLGIYSWRPDVGAVIHAHPPFATGFAAAGVEIREDALAEAAVALGRVPVVPYRTPGMQEAGEIVRPYLAMHRALLLGKPRGSYAWPRSRGCVPPHGAARTCRSHAS